MEIVIKPVFGFAEGFKVEIVCIRADEEIMAATKGIKKYNLLLFFMYETIFSFLFFTKSHLVFGY